MRIKQIGDPILREKSLSIEIQEISNPEVIATIDRMKSILNGIKRISDENGNALSAPQVGHSIRLVVLRINGQFEVMINPQIVASSESTFEFTEECFSLYNLRAKVTRHRSVTVTFYDEHKNYRSKQLQGEKSGLIQHEIDHLDGIFFLDKVTQNESIESIDHLLKDSPKRLAQVKEMMDYMAG